MLRRKAVALTVALLQIGRDEGPKMEMPKRAVTRPCLRGGQGIPTLDDLDEKASLLHCYQWRCQLGIFG